MKCPVCGSERIGKILYGLPDFTEELMRRCENEEVYLGGCMILAGYPEYHCFACDHNIFSMPLRITKSGRAYYRNIVTAIRFVAEDFPKIFIEKKDDRILLEVGTVGGDPGSTAGDEPGSPAGEAQSSSAGEEPQASFTRLVTEAEWKELLETLYTKLYLHEWHRVFINRNFSGRVEWELDIMLTENRVEDYKGLGGFPPYWEELKDTFRVLIRNDAQTQVNPGTM